MIDGDRNRLEVATRFGATKVISSIDGKAAQEVMALTGNKGVDVAIEAVGVPGSFDMPTDRCCRRPHCEHWCPRQPCAAGSG